MKTKRTLLALLFAALFASTAFAGDVTFWVPPYGINNCKKTVDSLEFGDLKMKDAITALALQFWVPDTDRVVFQPLYAGSSSNRVNADNVAWFVNWGKTNNVPVLLCIYNGMSVKTADGRDTAIWNWEAVHESMRAENRTRFIKSVVDTMDKYRLDGVDIDFEGSGMHDNIAKADSALYLEFSKELADSVHARDGKVVKAAVFGYKYHSPSWYWWGELLKVYDGLETMGYTSSTAPIPGSTSPYGYYSTRIKFARNSVDDARYLSRLMLGLPSHVDEWLGTTADDNLAWFNGSSINDSSAKLSDSMSVGICVWDAQLKASAWKTGSVWSKIAQISADVRAKKNVPFDSSCARTAIPGRFDVRFLKNYLNGHQADNYASQGGSGVLRPGDKIVLKGHSCSEAVTVAEASSSNYLVHLTGDWMRADAIKMQFEKVTWDGGSPGSSSSSSGSSSSVAVVDGEQVQNNTFDGTDHWNVRAKNGSVLSTGTDESGLHVTIDSAGIAPLAISVNQRDMTLVAGETSTFAFRMSASGNASVLAVVGLGSSPYTQYSGHTIDAPGEPTVYTYTFVADETTTDARVVFEVSAGAGTTFDLQAVSMARGSACLLPDCGSAIGEKAFALPGFRAGATVYGITGKSLLTLPETAWTSVEQVRDAVRGRLPSGLYLVKFDGVSGAVRIPVSR